MTLSRRELLKRGAAAIAAGNVYALLDGLGAPPARAAATAFRPQEQYVLPGVRIVQELGVEVLVPPLHHRVVTAKVRATKGAGQRLEHALAALERRYPASPAGLGVTVAWGLPYFRRLGAKALAQLPADLPASKAAGRRLLAVRDAARFASDDASVVLEGNDVAVLLRSDALAHLDDAQHAIFDTLPDLFTVTSVRNGFVGNAKEMALAAGIPGAELIVDGVQMFLGFTSTQRAAMAPDRISSFETLRGYTDQKPASPWAGGASMHLSHLDEDVEQWWRDVEFTDQLRSMTRPGLSVPDKTYVIAEDVSRVETAADVHADLARFGGVGHSATLQTVTRLQKDVRDAYGTIRPRGAAIVSRADFNTLDNPFAQPAASAAPSAGVHFVAFAPSSGFFDRARRAMDGSLGDGSTLGVGARSTAQGFNAFIHATHRQNFLVPPRAHRAFPLSPRG